MIMPRRTVRSIVVTKVKKNMKPVFMGALDKALLRKRAVVESVIDQLKNLCQIEHTRHRSVNGFLLNLVAGLTAYSLRPEKPSIDLAYTGPVSV